MFWCVHLPRLVMLGSLAMASLAIYALARSPESAGLSGRGGAWGTLGACACCWACYVLVWGVPCQRRNRTSPGDGLAQTAYGSGYGTGPRGGFHGRTTRQSAAWAREMRRYRIHKPPLGYL